MHTKFIYLTYYVWRQAQRARTRCWLEWAPHSASTRSVLSTTYSTPVPLVREGQGVIFVSFSFSFWVPLSQLKHHPETTLKHWVWLLAPLDQKLPTLFSWSQAVPVPLFYHSDLVPTSIFPFAHHTFWSFRSNTQLTHSVPLLFSILCLLGPVDKLLMHLLGFSHQLLHLCGEGSDDDFWNRSTKDGRGRGLTRLQEGDWHQSRSSPKLGQEFLLSELVPPPLAGALVFETPIELHCDSKQISTFFGGYFIGL